MAGMGPFLRVNWVRDYRLFPFIQVLARLPKGERIEFDGSIIGVTEKTLSIGVLIG